MDNIIRDANSPLGYRGVTNSNVQASPRNSLGYLADMLSSVKGFGDKATVPDFVPLIGGTGLGELLMGKSPELVDDMSYSPSAGIRGSNAATGGLGTLTLDKRFVDLGMTLADVLGLGKLGIKIAGKGLSKLADKSGFDATRRAFIEGQGIGLNKPNNETAVNAASSVLSPLDEILHTQVTRRNVLKGAAAVGGLAATPALLRNFVKDAEHVVPKVADNVAANGVKHRYDNLVDYLTDVEHYSAVTHDYPDKSFNDIVSEVLQGDEQLYESMKAKQAVGFDQKHTNDVLNSFSPKAKAEMKAYKESHLNNWGESPDGTGIGLQLPDYAPRWYEDITHQLGQQGKKVEDVFDPYTEIPF